MRFTFGEGRQGWVARLPHGELLPAAAYGEGRVYVSGGFDTVAFYAFDATTGALEWVAAPLADNGPTAAVYVDGLILFNTESCTLFALDARTGRRLWSRWLGDPTLAQPAAADGLVYAVHPAPNGYRLSAFAIRTGKRVWSKRIAGELLAAPVLHGDALYASTISGLTYRFDRRTGRRRWRRRLRATAAPWPQGEALYVARRTRRGGAVYEEQVVVSAADGQVLQVHHAVPGRHLADLPRDLSDWSAVWRFEGSRPVVAGGVRYVAMGAEVRASDARTGETLWVRPLPGAGRRRALGSVAVAGPQVVVATRRGQVIGLDIDTGYTVWAYDIGVPVRAQPIVARGWVYLTTTRGAVVALQVADPSLDGWHMFGGNPRHTGPVRPS